MTQQTEPLITCGGGLPGDHNGTKQTERDALIKRLRLSQSFDQSLDDAADMLEAQALRIVELGGCDSRNIELIAENQTLRAELDAIKAQGPVAARWPTVPGSHQYCGCKGCGDLGGDMELLYTAPVAPAKPDHIVDANKMVPLTDDAIEAIAHRTATKYTHRSDPAYHSYGFVRHTLIDFARKLLKAQGEQR